MPHDPILESNHNRKQQSLGNASTVDVTQDHHEVDSTLPDPGPGAVQIDLLPIPGYTITGELARGGMGRVLAGREELLEREVAIKVLLPGADAERFVTESKITARLPHPSIPPVYALGSLANGSPFLAMKLVRGKTLADELKGRPNTLHDLPRFLQIFEQIAQAVGFAHSQGIIHRDLKPANVMVGTFGEVQVMDWGLAKDLSKTIGLSEREGEAPAEPSSNAATIAWQAETPNQQHDQTRSGAILGTPRYMAPEQARGEVVNARADVFALGGILCAILTDKAVFGGTTVLETLQQAATGDTADALARLETSGADIEVVNLAKRCLAVMQSERPADGQVVASMVATYRQGVEDRLRKAETAKAEALVREAEQRKRRRILTWSATAIFLVLLLGTAISIWQAIRATDAEQATSLQLEKTQKAQAETATQLKKTKEAETEATKNLNFARKGNQVLALFFKDTDPKRYQTIGTLRNAFRNNLVKAAKELDSYAISDPLTEIDLQNSIGVSLNGLGEFQLGSALLEKCLKTATTQLGPNHPLTLTSKAHLGLAYLNNNQAKQAMPLLQETLKLRKEILEGDHPDTLTSLGNLARAYDDSNRLDLALPLYEETLNARKRILGTEHPDTLASMHNLATGYHQTGKTNLALPLYDESLKLRKKILPEGDPDTLMTMNNLAQCYKDTNKPDKAIPLFEEALPVYRATLTATHPNTLTCMNNLGLAYRDAKKFDQAIQLFEETLKLRKAKLGVDHHDTLVTLGSLGRTFCEAMRGDDASKTLREYIATQRKLSSLPSSQFCMFLALFAQDLLKCDQFATAEEMAREAIAIREKKEPDSWATLQTKSLLGHALLGQKKYAEAEPLLLKGYEGMVIRLPQDPPGADAARLAQNKALRATMQTRIAEALDRLIQLYTETNRPDEVKKWQAKKDKLPKETPKK